MPYPLSGGLYNPYGPVATFVVKGVQPPAAQYIGPSDQLQLTILSPNVGVTVMLGLRLLDLRGQVSPLQYKITTAATADVPSVTVITPGECFILSATIGQANVRRGQSYCTLLLQRGQPTEGAAVGDVLISGYPTKTETLGFPQTPAQSSIDGRGAILVYTSPVPAMGAPALITVPPATRWRLIAATIVLASGSALEGGNALVITDSTGKYKDRIIYAGDDFTDGAGNTTFSSSDQGYSIPMDFWLNAGDVIAGTGAGGTLPGTSLSALTITVEELAEL